MILANKTQNIVFSSNINKPLRTFWKVAFSFQRNFQEIFMENGQDLGLGWNLPKAKGKDMALDMGVARSFSGGGTLRKFSKQFIKKIPKNALF